MPSTFFLSTARRRRCAAARRASQGRTADAHTGQRMMKYSPHFIRPQAEGFQKSNIYLFFTTGLHCHMGPVIVAVVGLSVRYFSGINVRSPLFLTINPVRERCLPLYLITIAIALLGPTASSRRIRIRISCRLLCDHNRSNIARCACLQ